MNHKRWLSILVIIFLYYDSLSAQALFTDTIPLGGNAYTKSPAEVTDEGLRLWTDSSTVVNIYFRTGVPQTFDISLRLQVPKGKSKIQIVSGNTSFTSEVSNAEFNIINIGKLAVSKSGYVRVSLKGIHKEGDVFANVSDLIISYKKQDTSLVYVKNRSSFHFGRRGPSVHLNFPLPEDIKNDIHWFYNEIEIPKGEDRIGSYFMADGFGEGYFGMQVNSDTERRVLFSVWSPYETENPKDIPDRLRIVLLKKGADVRTGEFGNEGSGGQSFLRFKWQAGNTYAFLLGAQPDTIHRTTIYTAYFKDVSAGKWYLVASFKRPQKATYLTHLYSFLENFSPETGDEERIGWYKNQWVMDGKRKWHELLNANFTYDATAKGGYRKDYAGGAEGSHFYLRNDGFFNDFVKPYQTFMRKSSGKMPMIDIASLPEK